MSAQPQLSDLPSVYIETTNRQSITNKDIYIPCIMTVVDGDSIAVYNEMAIRGRGNSTWNLAKKPYRIRFDVSTKFLGKGYAKAKSWVLLANHADKTLLRNALSFELGRLVGMAFNPATRFVDLVLNGEYLGTYQISDQIKVDKHRVEITEQEFPIDHSSNISGAYLLEMGGFATGDPVWFRTRNNVLASIKYPDSEDIVSLQKTYIQNYIQNFENALFSADFKDGEKGYRPYVDSASLVNYYIATELSANVDGLWSTYLYKEKSDPKLYFGPLWDFDIAYNNCDRIGDVRRRLMVDAGYGPEGTQTWYRQMVQDNWFNQAVYDRWISLLANDIENRLLSYTDSLAQIIQSSRMLNYQKWSISQHVYNEIFIYDNYEAYIRQLKSFLSEHIAYLTEAFAEKAPKTIPGPEPGILFDREYYYTIANRGNAMCIDIDGGENAQEGAFTELYEALWERHSQQWQIVPVGKYYFLLNRANGLALNDPTATTGHTGERLNLVPADSTDTHQLWKILPSTESYYNLVNVFSDNAANNSGGASSNGNPIVSYTNDERNKVSNNRQWSFAKRDKIESGQTTGLSRPTELLDYVVCYQTEKRIIRFLTMENVLPAVHGQIHNIQGHLIRHFSGTEHSVADLPSGTYLLQWRIGKEQASTKFIVP